MESHAARAEILGDALDVIVVVTLRVSTGSVEVLAFINILRISVPALLGVVTIVMTVRVVVSGVVGGSDMWAGHIGTISVSEAVVLLHLLVGLGVFGNGNTLMLDGRSLEGLEFKMMMILMLRVSEVGMVDTVAKSMLVVVN